MGPPPFWCCMLLCAPRRPGEEGSRLCGNFCLTEVICSVESLFTAGVRREVDPLRQGFKQTLLRRLDMEGGKDVQPQEPPNVSPPAPSAPPQSSKPRQFFDWGRDFALACSCIDDAEQLA